jgi:uncharacterized protein YeaO (DUF488 family)
VVRCNRFADRKRQVSVKLAVTLRRAYDPPGREDGPRVLVDRLWPRGVSKERLTISAWFKELGPSTALRKWFRHDPTRWEVFRARYLEELALRRSLLNELAAYARNGKLTLVFGARDPVHNQAVVIKEVLEGSRSAAAPPPARRNRRSRRDRVRSHWSACACVA